MSRIWIYESELRAIAEETLAWPSETGGDLFGYWEREPVVLLATRLGPHSIRRKDRCQFDLVHLEKIGLELAVDWGLHFFGDWHSHYHSTTNFPSRTDCNRLGQVMQRNGFERMIEFITNVTATTLDLDRHRASDGFILNPSCDLHKSVASVNGYDFLEASWYSPELLELLLIPGVSPVREALVQRDDNSSRQDWRAGQSTPLETLTGYFTDRLQVDEVEVRQRDRIARRAFTQLIFGLEALFLEPVVDRQRHGGRELSVQIGTQHFCLLFGLGWPFPLLEATYGDASMPLTHVSHLNDITAVQVKQIRILCGSLTNGDVYVPVSNGAADTSAS